jgi:calcium-dependent protein kinase
MKLIDFGCAKLVKDTELIRDVAGSPYYAAPWVLLEEWRDKRTGAVWKCADMWSIGVIVFMLVCGYPPFNGRTQDAIFDKIKKGKFKFPARPAGEPGLSEEVKDLITRLLTMDMKAQLTVDKALEHPWLSKAQDIEIPASVVKSLTTFQKQTRLRAAVGRVLRNEITDTDKESLAAMFKQFDINGDGKLNAEEISNLMRHIGHSEDEAKILLSMWDEDKDGVIDMDELKTGFAASKLGEQTRKELAESFKRFDADGDGFVSAAEIEKMCSMKADDTRKLIAEVDKNGDGRISFEEWLIAIKGNEKGKGAVAAAAKPAAAAAAAPPAS